MAVNAALLVLDKSVQTYPERMAVVGDGLFVSYRALGEHVDAAGMAFLKLGCRPGERVMICLPDCLEFIVAFFASLKIGAIPVPVSPYGTSHDYLYYLKNTGARLAIVTASALSNIPGGTHIVIAVGCSASSDQHLSWEQAVEHTSAPRLQPHLTTGDELALLMHTSGSSGRQKCVMHSANAIAIACRNVGSRTFGLGPDDRILSIPKPFFSFGLGFGVLFPLFAGACTIVSSKRADLKEAVNLIRRHRPTVLCAVPGFLSVLLQARGWLDMDLSSLKFVVSAGEPLGTHLFEGFKNAFGLEVVDGIGSTEMFTHFISNRPHQTSSDSCGTEVPDCRVRLVNDDGEPVADGEVGKLMVTSPTRFMGYWRNPEETARVCQDEWVLTGDTLYRDKEGRYHFCGRNDDMLKVSGAWVMPQEIEAALCQHPNVARAFVTTGEDNAGRRRLIAYVVGQAAANPSSDDLFRFLRSKVSQDLMPGAFVVLPAMPATSNGKIDRRALPVPDWR